MKKSRGELEYIEVSNTLSSIKIALQGAHIFDFSVKGKKPLLYLSERARFEKGIPIRGGVPICWPWFGPHPSDQNLPNHGFARISIWEHLLTQEISPEKTKIIMVLRSSPQSLKYWPFHFELKLEILISDRLELRLITKNTDEKDFAFSQALHSYLLIDNIHTTQLHGLDKTSYYNKVNNTHDNLQKGSLSFTQEVDRVYHGVEGSLLLKDHEVKTIGSQTVVIWNPGKELVKKMPDLSSYEDMLCIESASGLENEIILTPSSTHTLKSVLTQT